MNVEYDEFHKFIASLGIILISLAFLIPWLFLKEPFDLLVKDQEIKLLTPIAQNILYQRQDYVLLLIGFIKPFVYTSFILGFVFLFWGAIRWNKIQKIIDKQKAVDLETAQKKLESIPQNQLDEKREEEAKEQIPIDSPTKIDPSLESPLPSPSVLSLYASQISHVEEIFATRLSYLLKTSYEVLTERRMGSVNFDIIIMAKRKPIKDYIIELKYVKKGFHFGWLRDNLYKTLYASTIYAKEMHRPADTVLVVILSKDCAKNNSLEEYKRRAIREIDALTANANITFIAEEGISDLSREEIYSTILRIQSE